MRLKNICKIVAATLPLCALGGLSGCSDAWDDHYGQVGESSTSSLLECV